MPCKSTSDDAHPIWHQTLTPLQRCLEPTHLGWSREANGELKPILTRILLVPQCVSQFVKCGCRKSMCKGNCCCRINNVQCTELYVHAKLMLKNVNIVLFCIIPTMMNLMFKLTKLIQLYFVKLKLIYYMVHNYLKKIIAQLFCMKDT